MSFLSLSKGDPAARALLQRAIRARYGLRPVPFDSMRIWLSRTEKGPLGLPVHIVRTISYSGTAYWRRDETHKLFGLPIRRLSASFSPDAYYERKGNVVTKLDDPELSQGMRRLVWLDRAIMLTPLTMEGVALKARDATCFEVFRESDPQTMALVCLDGDDNVRVEGDCYRPFAGKVLPLKVGGQGVLKALEGFPVPSELVFDWGDGQPEVFSITRLEVNPDIHKTEFALG